MLPSSSSGSGSQVESARRSSQPTIGDLLQRRRPEGSPARAGGAAPKVGADSGPRATPPPVDPVASSGQAGQVVPPPAMELPREEPARSSDADARALVKAKGPALEPQGASQPLPVSVGTMEKEWRDADVHEVTSREGKKGMASMEMFFSDFRAFVNATAAEADGRLKRVEKSVTDKRTGLYNRLVASYHKAKTDRTEMACELEVAKAGGRLEFCQLAAAAARVPQLEEDLRILRVQCADSQEVAKALAAKAKETEGELSRLRRLEANHLAELDSVKRVEQEKVDNLNLHLNGVDEQCQKLNNDMVAQSKVLTKTAKHWVEEISALDRGLAGTCRLLSAGFTGFLQYSLFISTAFPETQKEALAAAGKAQEERQLATGESGSEFFSMDDHLASIADRVEPVTMLGYELGLAVEDLYRLLWPTETLLGEIANLVKWLETAPDRLLDWKDSATRAGADMALSFVLSWYEDIDLDQLETLRAGVEDALSTETKTRRLARACAIADFVNKGVFVSDPNPLEEEEAGEDEDMADTEEGVPEAPGSDVPPAGPSPAGA
ncbi:hypothetical protein QYE76_057814 [Lolium multiflorum]|uniref:Uncharacterized protein n=1 Tax=Lolium multiflorum TaxID=4521 RepID=A0AAD8WRS6_LOLMU|nr:hypothetical protein QYE76_057814 [Lolium multiflorum]